MKWNICIEEANNARIVRLAKLHLPTVIEIFDLFLNLFNGTINIYLLKGL